MHKIILTKLNGKNQKKEFDSDDINKYSLNENILELLEVKNNDIDKKTITITNNFIRDIFKKYQNIIEYDKILNIINSDNVDIGILELYKKIIKNFNIIIQNFPQKRRKSIKESLTKTFKANPEYIIKIIIKEFTTNYFNYIILNNSENDLKKCYLMIIRNDEPNKIIEPLNIYITNKKYKNLIEKTIIKRIKKTHENIYPHLCWEYCDNLNNCDKIDDRLKKSITKYNFITDGYHIIDIHEQENGKQSLTTDSLYVISCKNYVHQNIINKEVIKRKTRTK